MRATHRLAPRPELAREGADGVIGRSETRDTPRNPVATLETALLFGTRVAKPILAAVMCAVRPLDRTYDRKRSDPRLLHLLLRAGGRPHMDSGSRDRGEARVASAGMTAEDASTSSSGHMRSPSGSAADTYRDGDKSVLATRKPRSLLLMSTPLPIRPAERTSCGKLIQEPPRRTRSESAPPLQGEPSLGAPS